MDQGGQVPQAGERPGLGEEVVIKGEGRAHGVRPTLPRRCELAMGLKEVCGLVVGISRDGMRELENEGVYASVWLLAKYGRKKHLGNVIAANLDL